MKFFLVLFLSRNRGFDSGRAPETVHPLSGHAPVSERE